MDQWKSRGISLGSPFGVKGDGGKVREMEITSCFHEASLYIKQTKFA